MKDLRIALLHSDKISLLDNVLPDVFDNSLRPELIREFVSDSRHHGVARLRYGCGCHIPRHTYRHREHHTSSDGCVHGGLSVCYGRWHAANDWKRYGGEFIDICHSTAIQQKTYIFLNLQYILVYIFEVILIL